MCEFRTLSLKIGSVASQQCLQAYKTAIETQQAWMLTPWLYTALDWHSGRWLWEEYSILAGVKGGP